MSLGLNSQLVLGPPRVGEHHADTLTLFPCCVICHPAHWRIQDFKKEGVAWVLLCSLTLLGMARVLHYTRLGFSLCMRGGPQGCAPLPYSRKIPCDSLAGR